MAHFDPTLEEQHRDERDWIFGADSEQGLFEPPSRSNILMYLPLGEVQRGKEDVLDCASRGPINKLETNFSYGYEVGLISPQNRKWLRDKGYADKFGIVTFSDAFIAIKSGTTRNGNSMKAPLQAIHEYGLIPKAMLPLESWMKWEDTQPRSNSLQMC